MPGAGLVRGDAGVGHQVHGGAHDAVVGLLATLGISSLFLFAGLEVDLAELRRGLLPLVAHLVVRTAMLALVAWMAWRWLRLDWQAAALLALAGDPQVQSGDVSTRLIDERGAALLPDAGAQTERAAVLGAVSLLVDAGALASPAGSPWDLADGWSVHGAGESLVRLESASDTYLASVRRGPDGDWLVRLGTRESRLQGLSIIERTGGALRLTGRLGSTPIGWTAHVEPDRVSVWLDGEWHRFERLSRASEAGAAAVEGVIRASMPGLVLAVRVNPGDRVTRGQALVVLEAMKMEHTMTASGTGVVSEVRVRAGDRVREGDALLAISAGED